MKINILIPTYNRAESLRRTLNSIMAFPSPGDFGFNVFVVNNNCTDSTKSVVEEFSRFSQGRIQYLFEPQPGRHMALNHALKVADGDVLIFTDDDITFDPHWLNVVAENFKDPGVHCLTGKIVPVYDYEKPSWYSQRLFSIVGDVDFGEERKNCEHATGANTAIRSVAFKAVGGFPAYRELINEDTFLSKNLLEKGYAIIYEPRMVIYHHFQKEKFTQPYFRQRYRITGRTIAELNTQKDKGYRCLFNIPLWRYRQTVEHALMMLWNLFNEPERFYHELQIRRFFGFCYQRWFSKQS